MKLPTGIWENITPKKATDYLNNNPSNRKLRPGVAEKYASDMVAGNWLPNPQPIMFYEDGELADGQHRLFAVVESGKTIAFYVIRDVPKNIALNIDTGLARTLADNARIAGWDHPPVSHRLIAIATAFHFGHRITGQSLSNAQRLALISAYEPHIIWADQHVPKKRSTGTAVIAACVARAHQHERDHDRLGAFCAMLGNGMVTGPQDHAAVALRTYLVDGGPGLAYESRDLILKCMNAIRYFMRRKCLTVIKGVKEEAYPLKNAVKFEKKRVSLS